LNSKGQKLRAIQELNGGYDSATIHHLPIKYLTRSDIDTDVGQTINQGVKNFLGIDNG
jgi:5,10-methylenetetrahydrofolate reductase